MQEFKMTMMLRIATLISLAPLGLLFVVFGGGMLVEHTFFAGGFCLLLGLAGVGLTAAIWVYQGKKRIVLGEDFIAEITPFGETRVQLDENTRITHDVIVVNTSNGIIGGLVVGVFEELAKTQGEAATKHINITVSHGGREIKLTSNVKGIVVLRERLAAFELKTILPSIQAMLSAGGQASFGQVLVHDGTLRYDGKNLLLSEVAAIEIRNKNLVIKGASKPKVTVNIPMAATPNIRSLISLLKPDAYAEAAQP